MISRLKSIHLKLFLSAITVLTIQNATAVQLTVKFQSNIFFAGERKGFTVTAYGISNTVAIDYSGYVRLTSDCASLQIMGKNPDGSVVGLPNSGDVLLQNGQANLLYLYSPESGTFNLKATETIQNSTSPASQGSTSFTVRPSPGPLQFSEILSDVIDNNYAYLEIRNRSSSPVNLSNLCVFKYKSGNTYNTTNRILTVQNLSSRSLGAGQFFLAVVNKNRLSSIFPGVATNPTVGTNVFISDLDLSGHLTMTLDDIFCDAFAYSSSLTPQDSSLERVSYDVDPFASANWTPSLTRARKDMDFYGTPGTANGTARPTSRSSVNLSLTTDKKLFDRSVGPMNLFFSTDLPGRASLFIMDSRGNIVRRLLDEMMIPSLQTQTVGFDCKDTRSHPLPTGYYVALFRFINDSTGIFKEKALSFIISQ